jgi:hypothetical protein
MPRAALSIDTLESLTEVIGQMVAQMLVRQDMLNVTWMHSASRGAHGFHGAVSRDVMPRL